MKLTLTERYLAGFHDANPGVTSRAFAQQAVSGAGQSFASTYHALLSALPDTGTPITVLDLACGDGHLLGLLAGSSAAGHTLIGVDLSHVRVYTGAFAWSTVRMDTPGIGSPTSTKGSSSPVASSENRREYTTPEDVSDMPHAGCMADGVRP